jgi:H+/gluconate symporter-like permease
MTAEIMFRIVVFALVAFLATQLARRMAAPKLGWVWVVWLSALVVAAYIGPNIKLIAFSGSAIQLNDILQGFVFGLLAGWLIKKK